MLILITRKERKHGRQEMLDQDTLRIQTRKPKYIFLVAVAQVLKGHFLLETARRFRSPLQDLATLLPHKRLFQEADGVRIQVGTVVRIMQLWEQLKV